MFGRVKGSNEVYLVEFPYVWSRCSFSLDRTMICTACKLSLRSHSHSVWIPLSNHTLDEQRPVSRRSQSWSILVNYGARTMNPLKVYECVERFKARIDIVTDESRSGRQSTSLPEEHVQRKDTLIRQDRRITLAQVTANIGHQLWICKIHREWWLEVPSSLCALSIQTSKRWRRGLMSNRKTYFRKDWNRSLIDTSSASPCKRNISNNDI